MPKEALSKEMRVREVPLEVHKKIVIHQKILALQTKKDITLDEACIDLWERALKNIPAIESVA